MPRLTIKSVCTFCFAFLLINVLEYAVLYPQHGLSSFMDPSSRGQKEAMELEETSGKIVSIPEKHKFFANVGRGRKLIMNEPSLNANLRNIIKDVQAEREEVKKLDGNDLVQFFMQENSDYQSLQLTPVQRQYIIEILEGKLERLQYPGSDRNLGDGASSGKNNNQLVTRSIRHWIDGAIRLEKPTCKFPDFIEAPSPEQPQIKPNYLRFKPEIFVENMTLESRTLTPSEASGNDILFTLRTTQQYHNKRLPLLMETWLSKVNRSNVYLVTDGNDALWQKRSKDAGTLG